MLEFFGVEFNVLIRDAKLFERPCNARAGTGRPGIQFDSHFYFLATDT